MSDRLWPFFCYYGGKWRAAPHYPLPMFGTIVEPFAGAAGYAVRYAARKIILADSDPVIAGLWRYLIRASAAEIMALPTAVDHVDNLHVSQEAKWLIGFWLNKATASPCKQPSAWMRSGIRPNSMWGDAIKERIASQVDAIRHWIVVDGAYNACPDIEATWFVDPPYNNKAGGMYRHQVSDYSALASWCGARKGQVIVCENVGATWLPFRDFGVFKSTEGKHGKAQSREAIYQTSNLI